MFKSDVKFAYLTPIVVDRAILRLKLGGRRHNDLIIRSLLGFKFRCNAAT